MRNPGETPGTAAGALAALWYARNSRGMHGAGLPHQSGGRSRHDPGAGRATFDELAHLGQQLIGDPDYDDEMPQLIDLRGLRIAAGGALDALQGFVQRHYRQRVNASVAVVIDDHLERRHAATIFRLTCEIGQAELFSDYGLAIKWLMRQAFAPATYQRRSGQQHHAGRQHAQRTPE